MSMILDAMKRSKQGEAQSSGIPTVDTVHFIEEPEPRFTPLQVGLFATVGITIAAVSAMLVWPSQEPSPLTTQTSQAQSIQHAMADSPADRTTLAKPQSDRVRSFESQVLLAQSASKQVLAEVPERAREQNFERAPENVLEKRLEKSPATIDEPYLQAQRDGGISQRDEPDAVGNTQSPESARLESARVKLGETKRSGGSSGLSSEPLVTPAKPAGSRELQAIYRALNEEANESDEANERAQSNSVDSIGASIRQSDDSQTPESLLAENVRDVSTDVADSALALNEKEEAPPVDFADILAAAQEELGVKPLVESSEPLLETLSQQVKDDIPSLIYSEHNYIPSGSSSVTLNGKVLKERQRVGAFTVIEILPDSVVLRWRETQFRVRARNSWVNM